MPSDLDPLDRQIISELETDGRRAYRDIARSLDVSEATVRARVKRLQHSGVLKIVAFADPSELGDAQLALLVLRVDASEREAVATRLAERPEISYVSRTLGSVGNVVVQALVRDVEALERFVVEQVEALPGVRSVETLLEVHVHKLWFAQPPEL